MIEALRPDTAESDIQQSSTTGPVPDESPEPNLRASALKLWLLTRAATLLTVLAGSWLLTSPEHPTRPLGFLQLWNQWDTTWFVKIAHWGYGQDPADPASAMRPAFFPGLPILMRLLHNDLHVDFVAAGLAISFVAGGVAVVALARIAALAAGPDTPAAQLAERTVLLFLLGPSAVFLAAAYSEALFLAFALPAWLAAKRGRWWTAALLAACASTTRITGLCLAAALVVEFVTARDGRRRLSAAPSLALPFLPVLAYFAYLHGLTGDWMRWKHVQEQGWYRVSVWPWQGLQHSLDGVNSGFFTADGAWMFRVEIIAAFVGLALLVVLLRQRRWSESCYVGLQLTMLTTSYWWQAIPRNELTWWPLWVTLAAWSLRRPAVFAWYLAIAPAFMITFTLVFVNGRWAG